MRWPNSSHPPNPYAHLSALLDTTRPLSPEELAELQLEQGYVERALAAYEQLAVIHPADPHYRRRRDWLRRLGAVAVRPMREVSVDHTLRGMRSPAALADEPEPQAPEEPASEPGVRRMMIREIG